MKSKYLSSKEYGRELGLVLVVLVVLLAILIIK